MLWSFVAGLIASIYPLHKIGHTVKGDMWVSIPSWQLTASPEAELTQGFETDDMSNNCGVLSKQSPRPFGLGESVPDVTLSLELTLSTFMKNTVYLYPHVHFCTSAIQSFWQASISPHQDLVFDVGSRFQPESCSSRDGGRKAEEKFSTPTIAAVSPWRKTWVVTGRIVGPGYES